MKHNARNLRLLVVSSIFLFLILGSYSVFACGTECEIDGDCDDGLYCNGQETCIDGFCISGTPVDCSDNDLPGIGTCTNDPDGNPRTWDQTPGFTSICDEGTDSCTIKTYTYTHDCDMAQCGAECAGDSDCACPSDGCVGEDWYDYSDYGVCLSDCTCDSGTEYGESCNPTVYEHDERCVEEPPTTTTTTVPPTTTTTPPSPPSDGGDDGGKKETGASYGIQSCVINGICEKWENPQMCPSDCPEEDETTEADGEPTGHPEAEAVCGNDVCEEGEDFVNCPADCLKVEPITTTTEPEKPVGPITGMFAAMKRSYLYVLAALLALIAIVLAITRYKLLPKIFEQ